MALGNIIFKDKDGNLGRKTPTSTEKVSGLLFDISGITTPWESSPGSELAEIWKDTVVELNSLEDAVNAGIVPNEEPTTASGVKANFLSGIPYYHIKQFFDIAGGSGRLFVMFADCSENWNALIDMQKASGGIINQIGVWTEQNLWSHLDPEQPLYSINLVTSLQSIADQLADDYFAPVSILLCANSAKIKTSDGTEDNIVLSKIPTCIVNSRSVSVLLAQSMDPEVKAMQASLKSTTPVGVVGLALGATTVASVGESIAWTGLIDIVNWVPSIEMGFGNSTVLENKITNGTAYTALSKTQIDDLDDKGYIFMCNYAGLEGHTYFTSDRTCSDKDYRTIARNRTINKSRRLVRFALLPYINSPVKVDPKTGQLSAAQITIYRNLINDALITMETAGEISAIGNIVIPAEQNVLKEEKLIFSYSLVPLGCAKNIEVSEGLTIKR